MKNQYLKTIVLSFYNADAYRNAFFNWPGLGLRYLFLVAVITSAITCSTWFLAMVKISPERISNKVMDVIISQPNLTFEENLTRSLKIMSQIPKIKIENGEIITDVEQPYLVTDPVSGEELAILDISGKYTSLDETRADLLITKNTLLFRSRDGEDNEQIKTLHLRDLVKNYGSDEAKINEALIILSQVPPLEFKDGKFHTPEDKNFSILDSKGLIAAKIGPDAKLNSKNYEPMFIINNDEIAFKTPLVKDEAHIKSIDINEDTMFEFFNIVTSKIKKWLLISIPIIFYPFIIISSFVFGFIMVTFYSLICYCFMKFVTKKEFEFNQLIRITMVAITPVQIVTVLLPIVLPSQGFIYFLVNVGYIYFATKSVDHA